LGVNSSGEAIRSVLPVLADPDAGARAAGAEALGMVGSSAVRSASDSGVTREAVDALTGLLKDQDPGVRGAAAKSLGTIAGTAVGPGGGRRRGRAAKTAKAPSSSPAIDPAVIVASLLGLLGDRDAEVRQAALIGLRDSAPGSIGQPPQPLIASAEDSSADNRMIAVGILATYSSGLDPLVPVLLRHLEQDEPAVHDACSTALGRIEPSALTSAVIPNLIAGLGNHDRDVRKHLVTLLGGLKPDPRLAVPPLIKVLHETDESDLATVAGRTISIAYEGPAQEAAKVIGRIAPGTPAADEAISALADVVRSGPPKRRAAAAEALGKFGPAAARTIPAMLAYLHESLSSKEATVDGASAAEALGRIAPGTSSAPEAVTALTTALKCDSASTRRGALRALKSFGPAAAQAIEVLRSIEKNDPTPNVRKDAASTLEAILGKVK
jgi:HEAT repeat protein